MSSVFPRLLSHVNALGRPVCRLLAASAGLLVLAICIGTAWLSLHPAGAAQPEVVRPSGANPSVYEQNGMAWAGPYLTFHGTKPDGMALEVWARYATMSPNCRGADILECDIRRWYTPGNSQNEHMGEAKQQYLISRSGTSFTLRLPLGIANSSNCEWELYEVQFYGRHPYTARNGEGEKRTDVIKIGKPQALPGDSQSLTFPEMKGASFREPLKVRRKEAPDNGQRKLKPRQMVLQVPCSLDSEISEEETIYLAQAPVGRSFARACATKRMSNRGRAFA